jgi:hypothetical protein
MRIHRRFPEFAHLESNSKVEIGNSSRGAYQAFELLPNEGNDDRSILRGPVRYVQAVRHLSDVDDHHRPARFQHDLFDPFASPCPLRCFFRALGLSVRCAPGDRSAHRAISFCPGRNLAEARKVVVWTDGRPVAQAGD